MKRRDFLRTITASSAAAVVAPGITLASSQARTPRVGLLVPDHDLGNEFLSGWSQLDTRGSVIERIGSRHGDASRVVSAWLERGSVDLIVSAFTAHGSSVRVQLEARGVPMLVADLGANWARPGSALVVRRGLGLARGAYALGRHAARTGSRRVAVVTSSFDAGFDHVNAFRLGLESAGGRVLDTLFLDSSVVAWDANRLFDLRADAVFVATSDASSLKDVRFPLGTRVLASGLAPWSMRGVTLETAMSFDGAMPPARALGLEAARVVATVSELERHGSSLLSALLQFNTLPALHRLEMRDGRVLHRDDLEHPQAFDLGVQRLEASRSSGYTNAYPIIS
jgi:hypothetical protein